MPAPKSPTSVKDFHDQYMEGLPFGATPAQREAMSDAFMTGSAAFMLLMNRATMSAPDPQSAISAICEECSQFIKDQAQGAADRRRQIIESVS